MPYCPRCKYEYTDGQVECIDCGVMLVDELPAHGANGIDTDGAHFVPFRVYRDQLHAETVVEALANEGISAVIKGDDGDGDAAAMITNSAHRVVWVPDDEQEDAARIADSIIAPI
jgi:hypothetical protein